MGDRVGVGLIGSQFISSIHAESLAGSAAATVLGVASPTPGHARSFAAAHDIARSYDDYHELLALPDVELVVIGAPNDVHCEITLAAAEAGKHIVCEKPLCLSLAEADRMIEACDSAGVKLMYAECLCFAPKYVRLKQLLDSGALGEPTLVKQSEKHGGPHAAHFWDARRSGGGVTMDMGCHAIQFFRWLLDGAAITSVYAQMATQVHADRTIGDDNALLVIEFENGAVGLAEESWTKLGGMDDRAEVHGTKGVAYADLLQGSSIQTYSEVGYDYAVEKAGDTVGWTYTMFEELWNYGFPQELDHFARCVREETEPSMTGADGRAVLEALFAAYESARTGSKVALPFASEAARPIDLWKPPDEDQEG